MVHGVVRERLKLHLIFEIEAVPPEWRIGAWVKRDGEPFYRFERLNYRAQLHAAQAIRAWADAHLK